MASNFPAYKYIISRVGDPLFAISIGIGAAATRILREGNEKGMDTAATMDAGLRRIKHVLGASNQSVPLSDFAAAGAERPK